MRVILWEGPQGPEFVRLIDCDPSRAAAVVALPTQAPRALTADLPDMVIGRIRHPGHLPGSRESPSLLYPTWQ